MRKDTVAKDGYILVYVIYQGTPKTRFDQTYYAERHIPLVMQCWGPYGLESVVAYFPASMPPTGTIALCECRFESEQAMRMAFASAATPTVMADVMRFTDVEPTRMRASAL